ncbi:MULTISPECIES: acyl carrier protein [unclassified Sutcliffiella]|uniref:acyl carrier protein n=1 Tax=unclassified Sutcliffiella TaxID=2837532 RepID=UPI0030CD6A14
MITNEIKYQEITMTVKQMVKEQLDLSQSLEEIEDEIVFGTAYGFDSTALLEFILQLEEHFDIVIPDEDLSISVFGSITSITNYIIEQKG